MTARALSIVIAAALAFLPALRAAEAADLKTGKQQYGVNEDIVVTFKDGPGNTQDWITIVPKGAPEGATQEKKILMGAGSGSLMFRGLPAGEYEARLHMQGTDAKPVARHGFAVGGGAVAAAPPASRPADPGRVPGTKPTRASPLLGLWSGRHCRDRGVAINAAIVEIFDGMHAFVLTVNEALEPTDPRRSLISTYGVPRTDDASAKVTFKWYGGAHGGLGFAAQVAPGADHLVADIEGCRGVELRRVQPAADTRQSAAYGGTWSGHFESCKVGTGMLAVRMGLISSFPGEYFLDAEYAVNMAGAAATTLSNRQIFHGRPDATSGKIMFRAVVALSTKHDGSPNPHASANLGLTTITLDQEAGAGRLLGASNLCPYGEFSKEGRPGDTSPAGAATGPLVGQWEGYAQCTYGRDTPVTLTLSAFGALRLRGTIEYVPSGALVEGVIRQVVVGQAEPTSGGYAFTVEQTQRIGRQREFPKGFTLKVQADGPRLAATHSGLPCSSFDMTRVTDDSPSRRPSVALPPNGGTFFASRRPREKCEAFAAWFGKILTEHPGLVPRGTGDAVYPKAALVFADDDFVPVFGVPFDKLDRSRRLEIVKALHDNQCGQPEFRNRDLERWAHPETTLQENVEAPRSQMGITAIYATVREARRLRTMIRTAHEALADSAPFNQALAVLGPLERQLRADAAYLWPSEHRTALARVEARLGAFALVEARRDMGRIAGMADPAARLRELKEIHAGNRDYKKYLPEADRGALDIQVFTAQRTIAETLIGPTLEAIEGTGVAEDALAQIQVLAQRAEPTLSLLVDSLAADYRGRIETKRRAVFEGLVAQRLAALARLAPNKTGLAASAKWPAELKAAFAAFATSDTYRKAIEEHRSFRNRQLRDAVAAFEAELKQIPDDGDRMGAVTSALGQYLAWEGDKALPSSLEYQLIVESLKGAIPKPDHRKLTDDEYRGLVTHFMFVFTALAACGDGDKKDLMSATHKHHGIYQDYFQRNMTIVQALMEGSQRIDKSTEVEAALGARLREDTETFRKSRTIGSEALAAQYCEQRVIPTVTSGAWDLGKDPRTRALVLRMSAR